MSGHWLEQETQNTTHTDTTTNKMSRATLPSSSFAPSLSKGRAVAPPNHGATTPQRHAQAATHRGCACCVFDSYLFFLPVVFFSGRTIWCSYFDTNSNCRPHNCSFFLVVIFSGDSWCLYFDTTEGYLTFIPTNGQMTVPFFWSYFFPVVI